MAEPVRIALEVTAKRSFAWAVDWPGWCRAGRTPELAQAALAAAAPRYASVARRAGLALPDLAAAGVRPIDLVEGGGGTEFGVPSVITAIDRESTTADEAERLAALVAAAWAEFDAVAAASPEILRKGPRGGGRDRDRMVEHVIGADHAYALEIGVRHRAPNVTDRPAIAAERAAMLEVIAAPSDGAPLAGRRWTQRYAARRIAWHALDHAWEMEDRSDPSR